MLITTLTMPGTLLPAGLTGAVTPTAPSYGFDGIAVPVAGLARLAEGTALPAACAPPG